MITNFTNLKLRINQTFVVIYIKYNTLNIWVEKLAIFRLFLLDLVQKYLERILPSEHAKLYFSIILGQRVTWSEQFHSYQELIGTQHIFAASGYNLSVVLLVASIIIPKFLNKKFKSAIYFGLCIVYTWLVGWQASLVRALGMVAYMLIAKDIFRRTYQPIYGLGIVFFYLF